MNSRKETQRSVLNLVYFVLLSPCALWLNLKLETSPKEDFYINEVQLSDEFLVVPGMSEDAIIGDATIQKWRMKLDFEHDTFTVDPKMTKLQFIWG